MKLAKPRIDVGVMTDRLEAMLAFWQGPVGLAFEGLLPTGGGNHQHRHAVNGSVFKLNHPRTGVPEAPASGYRKMWIAREGLTHSQALVDPDGNRVMLVPPGQDEVEGIAMTVAVRDPEVHARFYTEALELEEIGDRRFRCGDSILFLEHDPEASGEGVFSGPGFRYLTIQVHDCPAEHARVLAAGGVEGLAPRRLGKVAHISMVCDPDGNWIELSQRASLTGSI